MIRRERVQERLRLFKRVMVDSTVDEAMWAVLQAEERYLKEEALGRRAFNSRAQAVVNEVCEMCNVRLADFLSPSKLPRLVEARWIAMRALRDLRFSLPVIGLHVGRTHPTVLDALDRVADRPDLLEAARDALAAVETPVALDEVWR